MQDIERISRQIGEQFRPERMILFGSYATGEQRSRSDVDLLVIMPYEGRSEYQAAKILASLRESFPVELIVRSPEEIRMKLDEDNDFIKEILSRGKLLYEA